MELTLPTKVNVTHPIMLDTKILVVIGANGAGKSSFGRDLLERYAGQAKRISGIHALFISDDESKLSASNEFARLQSMIKERLFMPRISEYEKLILQLQSEEFEAAARTILSEPNVDNVYDENYKISSEYHVFATEFLPGQYDQRADSASECIQLISQGERPTVRSAKVYALEGELGDADIAAIKHYVINPVEAREASLDTKTTLKTQVPVPGKVEVIEGFRTMSDADLEQFIADRGLAMDLADLQFCRAHFTEEQRDPTITEIKVIDTY